jgi:hypothetical protein
MIKPKRPIRNAWDARTHSSMRVNHFINCFQFSLVSSSIHTPPFDENIVQSKVVCSIEKTIEEAH